MVPGVGRSKNYWLTKGRYSPEPLTVFIDLPDNGDNWTMLYNCPIKGVTTLAAKDHVVFAGGFSALFATYDNGDTWTDLSNGLPRSFELFTLAIKETGISCYFRYVWKDGCIDNQRSTLPRFVSV